MSASSPLGVSDFINGYLELSSRKLSRDQFATHEKKVSHSMKSKYLSKEAITEIMKTLLVGKSDDTNLYANEKSLDSIIERCNAFVEDHTVGDTGIVVGSDQEIVGMISDIICDVLRERPFKSGNTELSILLSGILLKQVRKPFLFLNSFDREDFKKVSVNNLAMKLFFADKYKQHLIADNGKILKAVEVYENASRYSDESGSYLVEWHDLNNAIKGWQDMARANKE